MSDKLGWTEVNALHLSIIGHLRHTSRVPGTKLTWRTFTWTLRLQSGLDCLMCAHNLALTVLYVPTEASRNATNPVMFRKEKREFFIDNLLVRVHSIIELVLVDRPCAVWIWISISRGGGARCPSAFRPDFISQHLYFINLFQGDSLHSTIFSSNIQENM